MHLNPFATRPPVTARLCHDIEREVPRKSYLQVVCDPSIARPTCQRIARRVDAISVGRNVRNTIYIVYTSGKNQACNIDKLQVHTAVPEEEEKNGTSCRG